MARETCTKACTQVLAICIFTSLCLCTLVVTPMVLKLRSDYSSECTSPNVHVCVELELHHTFH